MALRLLPMSWHISSWQKTRERNLATNIDQVVHQ